MAVVWAASSLKGSAPPACRKEKKAQPLLPSPRGGDTPGAELSSLNCLAIGHQPLLAGLRHRTGFAMKRGHDRVNPASTEMKSVGAASYSTSWLPWRLQEQPEPDKLISSLQEGEEEEG